MARRRTIALRLPAVVAAVAVLSGCGGGSSTAPRSEPPASAPAAPAEPAIVACVPGARRAVSRAAGADARMRTTAAAPGEATCVYDAGARRVDVHVDANPQAEVRFERAVVERDQNAVWSGAPDRRFKARLRLCGFDVDEQRVYANNQGNGRRHVLWLATRPGDEAW